MVTQYEDPCVLWVKMEERGGGKRWTRYNNCRSERIAEGLAAGLEKAGYKPEDIKILLPGQEP